MSTFGHFFFFVSFTQLSRKLKGVAKRLKPPLSLEVFVPHPTDEEALAARRDKDWLSNQVSYFRGSLLLVWSSSFFFFLPSHWSVLQLAFFFFLSPLCFRFHSLLTPLFFVLVSVLPSAFPWGTIVWALCCWSILLDWGVVTFVIVTVEIPFAHHLLGLARADRLSCGSFIGPIPCPSNCSTPAWPENGDWFQYCSPNAEGRLLLFVALHGLLVPLVTVQFWMGYTSHRRNTSGWKSTTKSACSYGSKT